MAAPEFLIEASQGWARLYADSKAVSTAVMFVHFAGLLLGGGAAVGRFECSRHDSRYEPNGTYTSGRATRNMDRFAVRRAGDTVVVDIAKLIQSDTQKAQWEAAAVLL